MKEIHGVSEDSIVEVTEVAGGPTVVDGLQVGDDEIFPNLQAGVQYEVRRIKPDIRTSKVTVTLSPVEGQDVPSYKTIVASTYDSWPNGCSYGLRFDADGCCTHYADKFFDVEVIEE